LVTYTLMLWAYDIVVNEAHATSGKVADWRPDEVNEFFLNLPNPSGRTEPWGLLSV
jgi:hypothetical protein